MARKKKGSKVGYSTTAFIRFVWIICFLTGATILYKSFKREEEVFNKLFAEQEYKFEFKAMHIPCSKRYITDINKFPDCRPKKCGRFVMDNLITNDDVNTLLNIMEKGLHYGGSEGGASILDLHTGAMSKGVHFVNLYKFKSLEQLFNKTELQTYRNVKNKIQNALASQFGISATKLYLTKPTFFSRMNNKPPLSNNDEYWHPHVDKDTYPSFHYTTLLYLNDYGIDFLGGQFKFIEKQNVTNAVQPKKGRVLLFTSGAENYHYVERVTQGNRFAITIAFTCDFKEAIPDPLDRSVTNPYDPNSSSIYFSNYFKSR